MNPLWAAVAFEDGDGDEDEEDGDGDDPSIRRLIGFRWDSGFLRLGSRAGLAPGAGGEVVAGAEGGLEVAGVGEAGALGDLVEGEVGGEEEAFDVAEAEAEDFVFGGAAEGGFHAALEGATGGI